MLLGFAVVVGALVAEVVVVAVEVERAAVDGAAGGDPLHPESMAGSMTAASIAGFILGGYADAVTLLCALAALEGLTSPAAHS